MSTTAQIAANRQNAHLSHGPATAEGKAKSARNATRLGLFTTHDFVLPEDQPTYDALVADFVTELNPVGPLEQTYALEIIRASWRLQRCAKIESDLADRSLASTCLDSMEDEALVRTQKAVDRARSQASNSLRRATAELRRLQTERQTRIEVEISSPDTLGLAEFSQCLKALNANERGKMLARRNDREAAAAQYAALKARVDRGMAAIDRDMAETTPLPTQMTRNRPRQRHDAPRC